MSHQEFDELTSLYALGALDGDDLARFTGHLAGCAECRRAVAEHERVASGLALGLPPDRPSAGAREALLAKARASRTRPGPSIGAWRRAAAGLAIVAVGLGFLYMRARDEQRFGSARIRHELRDAKRRMSDLEKELAAHRKNLDRLAKMDALIRDIKSEILALQGTSDQPGAAGRIVWRGTEVAWSSNLPDIQGKVYELWALVDGKPVPAGTYDSRGNLIERYWKVPEGAAIKGFAISLEDKAVDSPTKVVMVPVQ